jgi:RHS repeat-associated protein
MLALAESTTEPRASAALPLAASSGPAVMADDPCLAAFSSAAAEPANHYYRARYYDPSIGRFISEDPIGLAGGVNLYAYALGYPVGYTDSSGLLVDALYDKGCGKLTIKDRDTGESISIGVESGGKPWGDPIPNGGYEILEQARNPDFFRLDPKDGHPRDDKDDATGRTHFRLHRPGRTIGCIAAKDAAEWLKARDLILRTKTEMVDDNFMPWWKFWGAAGKVTKYGDLTVRD